MEKQVIDEASIGSLTATLKALGPTAKLQVLRALSTTYTVETKMMPEILKVCVGNLENLENEP